MSYERYTRRVRALATRQNMDWFGQFVRVADEAVHYVAAGSGSPVLLVHGFFAWSFTWRQNLPVLASEFRCFAPDLRGWGLSQRQPAGGLSLNDQADLLADFLDAVGVKQAAVIGHSMGGEVALRFALRHGDRASGLVLVAPSALVQRRELPVERYLLGVPGLGPLLVRATVLNRRFAVRSLRGGYHDPTKVTPAAIAGYLLPARLAGSARTFLQVLRAADFGATAAQLHTVQQKTLIIWGEKDPWLSPAYGEKLAQTLPNSRLLRFPDCGHLPHEEDPERFHAAVLPFLRSL